MTNKKSPWEKEWQDLIKKEKKYAQKRQDGPTSVLLQKLDRVIPEKLGNTLNVAFFKGFELVFEKGTGVIEKTYNKEDMEAQYKVNEYAHELQGKSRTAREFTKNAKGKKTLNLAISSAEGIGLGLAGMAIPDIPLFIAMVLKSVYEVALSYGYHYDTDEEKIFILKLIEVAMCDDEEYLNGDREVNDAISYITENGDVIGGWNISKEEQMKSTSDSLVREMLYTKFLQQFMIVGVVGGIFDPVYISRISNYAVLKYRRRFLKSKISREKTVYNPD